VKRLCLTLLVPLLLLALAGCGRVRIETPEGFARMAGRGAYRAVSPEGVVFRVRIEKNDPEMGLEFWSRALRNHLEGEGYRGAGDPLEFTAGTSDGALYSWTVPYGPETWTWLTAFVVEGRRIYVAEAAGEHTLMRRYRPAIERSLESLDP
jgi:hypothetical protein